MPDEPRDHYQSQALKRLIERYGEEYVEDTELNFRLALFQAIVPLTAIGLFAIALTLTFFTSGWLNWLCIILSALLGLLAAHAFHGIVSLWCDANLRVLVYRDKFVIERGEKIREIAWDEVKEVYVKTRAGRNQECYYWPPGFPHHIYMPLDPPLMNFRSEWTALVLHDDEKVFIVGTLSDYDGISRAIQGEVNSRLYGAATAALESGKPVEFGPMTILPDRLEVDDYSVPWNQHGCTWLENGKLVSIDQGSGSIGHQYTTDFIPNVALASKLIGMMSEKHNPRRTSESED